MKKTIKITSLLVVIFSIFILISCDTTSGEDENPNIEIPVINIGENVLEDFDDHVSISRMMVSITTFGRAVINHEEAFKTQGDGSAKIWVVDHEMYKDQYKSSYFRVQTINKHGQDFRDFSKVDKLTIDVYNAGESPLNISLYLMEVRTLEYFSDKTNYQIEPGSWETLEFEVDKTTISSIMDVTNITHIGFDMAGVNGLLYVDNLVVDISDESYKRYEKINFEDEPINILERLDLRETDIQSFEYIRPNGASIGVSNLEAFAPEYTGTLKIVTKDSDNKKTTHAITIGTKRKYGVFEDFENAFTTEFALTSSTIVAEKRIIDVDEGNGLYLNLIGGANTSIMIDINTSKFNEYKDFDYVSIRFKANYKNDITGSISFRFNDKWVAPTNENGVSIPVSVIEVDGEWVTYKYHKSQFTQLFGTELLRTFIWITKYQADDLEIVFDKIYGGFDEITKEADDVPVNLVEHFGYEATEMKNLVFSDDSGASIPIENPEAFKVLKNGYISFDLTKDNLKETNFKTNVRLFEPSKGFEVIDDFEDTTLDEYTFVSGSVNAEKSFTSDSFDGNRALQWYLSQKTTGGAIFLDFLNSGKYQYINEFDEMVIRYKATYLNGQTYNISTTLSIATGSGGPISGSVNQSVVFVADGDWHEIVLSKEQTEKLFTSSSFDMLRAYMNINLADRGDLEIIFDQFEAQYAPIEVVEDTSININQVFGIKSEDTVSAHYKVGEDTPFVVTNLAMFTPETAGVLILNIKRSGFKETVFEIPVTIVHERLYTTFDNFDNTAIDDYSLTTAPETVISNLSLDTFETEDVLRVEVGPREGSQDTFVELNFNQWNRYEHYKYFDYVEFKVRARFEDETLANINVKVNNTWALVQQNNVNNRNIYADGNWKTIRLNSDQFVAANLSSNFQLYFTRFAGQFDKTLEIEIGSITLGYDTLKIRGEKSMNLYTHFGLEENELLSATFNEVNIINFEEIVITESGVLSLEIAKVGFVPETINVYVDYSPLVMRSVFDDFENAHINNYSVVHKSQAAAEAGLTIVNEESNHSLMLTISALESNLQTDVRFEFNQWLEAVHEDFDYIEFKVKAQYEDGTLANIGLRINQTWLRFKTPTGVEYRDNIAANNQWLTLRLSKEQYEQAFATNKFEFMVSRWALQGTKELNVYFDDISYGYTDKVVQEGSTLDLLEMTNLLPEEVTSAIYVTDSGEFPITDVSTIEINESGQIKFTVNKTGYIEETFVINITTEA